MWAAPTCHECRPQTTRPRASCAATTVAPHASAPPSTCCSSTSRSRADRRSLTSDPGSSPDDRPQDETSVIVAGTGSVSAGATAAQAQEATVTGTGTVQTVAAPSQDVACTIQGSGSTALDVVAHYIDQVAVSGSGGPSGAAAPPNPTRHIIASGTASLHLAYTGAASISPEDPRPTSTPSSMEPLGVNHKLPEAADRPCG
jgi:hypothetical protein